MWWGWGGDGGLTMQFLAVLSPTRQYPSPVKSTRPP